MTTFLLFTVLLVQLLTLLSLWAGLVRIHHTAEQVDALTTQLEVISNRLAGIDKDLRG